MLKTSTKEHSLNSHTPNLTGHILCWEVTDMQIFADCQTTFWADLITTIIKAQNSLSVLQDPLDSWENQPGIRPVDCLSLMPVSILGNEALLMQYNSKQHMDCTCVCLLNCNDVNLPSGAKGKKSREDKINSCFNQEAVLLRMDTMLHRRCFNSAQGQQEMSEIHIELLPPVFSLSLLKKKSNFREQPYLWETEDPKHTL